MKKTCEIFRWSLFCLGAKISDLKLTNLIIDSTKFGFIFKESLPAQRLPRPLLSLRH
jgi:hypothetical protein